MNDLTPINLSGIATTRIDEYFGLWAIDASRGLAMFERIRGMDLKTHVETTDKPRPTAGMKNIRSLPLRVDAMPDPTDPGSDSSDDSLDEAAPMAADGNIAVIYACGTLMKQESSLDASTSTIALRRQLRQVKDDPRFAGCILCIDSPGGTVAGTSDLAADVAALAAVKPVIGHVQDLCASAAYWAASQCTELYANNGTALVGSIGTFIGTYDYSKMAEQEGIEAKVYATGDLKGAGFPGAKITPEQDAFFQGIVDSTQVYFAAGVAQGRGMSAEDVNKLATGAVFLAGDAANTGLIDGIKSFDQCMDRMGELLAQRQQTTSPGIPVGAAQEFRMKTESGQPAANAGAGSAAPTNAVGTKVELKRYTDAFGTASGAAWYLEGKTFEEATALHNQAATAAADTLKKENAELREKNTKLEARVKELRGEQTPVNADLTPDPEAARKVNPGSLENRLGANMARVARSIKLPAVSSN